MSVITQPTTLSHVFGSSYAKQALRIVGGSLFLVAMAKVAVGGPIPMSLGTLGVMLVALTLGARESIAAIVLYLAYGAIGFPVFAAPGAAGIAYMLGGTGGFLVGYLGLAAVTGAAADRGITRSIPGSVLAILAGTVILFACGVAWLTNLYGFEKAIAWGVTPFIVSEPIKIVLAALIGAGVLKGASRFARR
ncbi:MAG: biotin transporter BioY [Pseudomonadota bacterium]